MGYFSDKVMAMMGRRNTYIPATGAAQNAGQAIRSENERKRMQLKQMSGSATAREGAQAVSKSKNDYSSGTNIEGQSLSSLFKK